MKETQKQIIARLEEELESVKMELKEFKTLCNKLNLEILEMQQIADEGFLNSSDYMQMKKHIDLLENKNKILEKKIEHNNKVQKLITEKHNSRGAGRKTRFSDQERETIKKYRTQGKTIKEISDMFNCSAGLIHKLINEKE